QAVDLGDRSPVARCAHARGSKTGTSDTRVAPPPTERGVGGGNAPTGEMPRRRGHVTNAAELRMETHGRERRSLLPRHGGTRTPSQVARPRRAGARAPGGRDGAIRHVPGRAAHVAPPRCTRLRRARGLRALVGELRRGTESVDPSR